MAQSSQNRGDPPSEQSILQEPVIPFVAVHSDYEDEEFQSALNDAFAEYNETTQIAALLKRYESLSIESDDVSDNSSSLSSASLLSSSDQENNDGSISDDREYQGYFILPLRDARRMFEANSHFEDVYADRSHPALQQSPMPSYMMGNYGPYLDAQVYLQAFMPLSRDGPFDTRPTVIATRVSPFAARGDQLISDAAKSPYSMDEPGQHVCSVNDLRGTTGNNNGRALHDAQYYLKFTDEFRDVLDNRIAMYDDELDMLNSVLDEILAREVAGKFPMQFSTIVFARLEKLLKSLVDYPRRGRQAARPSFRNAVRLAVTIQRKWQMRFQGRLFSTDGERMIHILTNGILARVHIEPSFKGDGSAGWVAETSRPGADTNLINFSPGQWWPNTACALRDGVANLTGDKKVGSYQLVTYITLLRGVETFDSESNCMIYDFKGRLKDVLVHLQDKVGKRIRLIRGYKLKSCYAPKIGIRYDGIHTLRRYSLKLFDANKHLYHLMLHYDAVKGESGNNKEFIKPSLRDDWELYKKIEKAEMKRLCSEESFNAWKAEEEREVNDSQEWHRRQKFRQQAKDLKL